MNPDEGESGANRDETRRGGGEMASKFVLMLGDGVTTDPPTVRRSVDRSVEGYSSSSSASTLLFALETAGAAVAV